MLCRVITRYTFMLSGLHTYSIERVSKVVLSIPTSGLVSRIFIKPEVQFNLHSTLRMACTNLQEMSKEQQTAFAGGIDWLMFDCDGCLWDEHDRAYDGAVEALQILVSMGKKVSYVTNNSSVTRADIAAKCQRLGFAAAEDQIINAGWLTANYIKNVLKFEGKVYLLGTPALEEEFTKAGINYECKTEQFQPNYKSYFKSAVLDPEIKAVVVGFDPHVSYMKVMKACSYLQREGCLFLVTNMDSYLPIDSDIRVPGTGSIASFVKFGAEKEPTVVGKPSTIARDILALDPTFNPARILMVGDRLDTDVAFGNNCGFQSMLVLTGAHNLDDVQKAQASNSVEDQKTVPGFYLGSVGQLTSIFKQ